jgi:hypothetical protein
MRCSQSKAFKIIVVHDERRGRPQGRVQPFYLPDVLDHTEGARVGGAGVYPIPVPLDFCELSVSNLDWPHYIAKIVLDCARFVLLRRWPSGLIFCGRDPKIACISAIERHD